LIINELNLKYIKDLIHIFNVLRFGDVMFKSFGGPVYFVVALSALSDSSTSDIKALVRLDGGAGVNA